MKNINRGSYPQKNHPALRRALQWPSRMMISFFSPTELEFWWSKIVLIGGSKPFLCIILKSRFLSVIF